MKMGQFALAHRIRMARCKPLVVALAILVLTGVLCSPEALSWRGTAWELHPTAWLASEVESGPRSVDRKGLDLADVPATTPASEHPARGGVSALWQNLLRNPVLAKAVRVGDWILVSLKLLWSIPKAIVQGDSRALIEAIGDLLSRAAPETQPETVNRASQGASRGSSDGAVPGAAGGPESPAVFGPAPRVTIPEPPSSSD